MFGIYSSGGKSFLMMPLCDLVLDHKCRSISKEQPRLWHILTQFSISVFGEYGGSSVK